jgi:alpha-L-rhamnosidase
MNSYNHYAFGSVIAWVYRYMAGIDTSPESPAFKKIVIRPHLDPRVTFVNGEYDSMYGKIVSDWKGSAEGPFSLTITIPANTTAEVFLPATSPRAHVTESGKKLAAQRIVGDSLVVSVGSGSYNFHVEYEK